jgi:hypothetical protein
LRPLSRSGIAGISGACTVLSESIEIKKIQKRLKLNPGNPMVKLHNSKNWLIYEDSLGKINGCCLFRKNLSLSRLKIYCLRKIDIFGNERQQKGQPYPYPGNDPCK